jgi:hypothetical protein
MALLAMDYSTRAMNDEALAWAERACSLSPWDALPTGLYAGLLTRAGEAARGKRVLEKLGDGKAYAAPLGLALFHLLAGDIETAVDWLDRLIQQRHVAGAFFLLHSPVGKSLFSSDRWHALAKTLNLPQTTSAVPELDR